MNRDYCLTGTKIVIRRLFKSDTENIISCYSRYSELYHNPVNREFLENVFICGEIWGAYLGDMLIGCCYYFPADSSFFGKTEFFGILKDIIPSIESHYFMGYVGIKYDKVCRDNHSSGNMPTENGLYQTFVNIAQMQAFRRGYKYILHTSPVKLNLPFEVFFVLGCTLVKMRGLENLVVHYIFTKAVMGEENIYESDANTVCEKVCIGNTKKISALLESGYCGVDYSDKDKLLYLRRLIAD